MNGALIGGEGVGRGGGDPWLFSLVRADSPARGLGPRLNPEALISWGPCLISRTPLLDLLHQSLDIHVLYT